VVILGQLLLAHALLSAALIGLLFVLLHSKKVRKV
jgi:hypothetical protein